ncbi:DNA primase [Peptococcaceae bacterium CEB3]|nr:DNA primase [Peptococcaceae bacterium CEB3]
MDAHIPEEILDEIRVRTDILDVISEYVSVQRKGKNYLGLCPFHSEKTPSFTVTPDKQIFYCFGCHVGGDVFAFLMKKEGWTFVEAAQHLARRQGMVLPEKSLSLEEQEKRKKKKRWEEIQELSANYFHTMLLEHAEGGPGRAYFAKRGIDRDMVVAFRLGYAPNRWDGLLRALSLQGVSPRELADAGLVIEKAQTPGQYYDRFRNRVIFSILDSRGYPVAFGGRVLDDSLPKYLNSPETPFFSKGQSLYGMNKAAQGIRAAGFALLAEGYMDVLALQQAGFANAVASLGTALTREQAKLLRRHTGRVVIVYDSDAAGTQATLRAAVLLGEAGLRVEVLRLTGAKDPDEFLRTHGYDAFKSSLTQTQTYVEFKYQIITKEILPEGILGKADVVAKLAPDIRKTVSPVEREGYERFLSEQLGLSLEAIQREIAKNGGQGPDKAQKQEYSPDEQDISVKNRDNINRYVLSGERSSGQFPNPPVEPRRCRAERHILRLVLEDSSLLSRVENELGPKFCTVPAHQEILDRIRQTPAVDAFSDVGRDLSEGTENRLAGIMAEDIDLSKRGKLLADCIQVILQAREEEKVEELQTRMAALERSGDIAGAMALLKEIGERLKRGEQ